MFEWDPKKNISNLRKHGISFADTFAVFEDPLAVTVEEEDGDEIRHISIGKDAFERVLVVVYAWRRENVRIISARKASKSEIKHYESQL